MFPTFAITWSDFAWFSGGYFAGACVAAPLGAICVAAYSGRKFLSIVELNGVTIPHARSALHATLIRQLIVMALLASALWFWWPWSKDTVGPIVGIAHGVLRGIYRAWPRPDLYISLLEACCQGVSTPAWLLLARNTLLPVSLRQRAMDVLEAPVEDPFFPTLGGMPAVNPAPDDLETRISRFQQSAGMMP